MINYKWIKTNPVFNLTSINNKLIKNKSVIKFVLTNKPFSCIGLKTLK